MFEANNQIYIKDEGNQDCKLITDRYESQYSQVRTYQDSLNTPYPNRASTDQRILQTIQSSANLYEQASFDIDSQNQRKETQMEEKLKQKFKIEKLVTFHEEDDQSSQQNFNKMNSYQISDQLQNIKIYPRDYQKQSQNVLSKDSSLQVLNQNQRSDININRNQAYSDMEYKQKESQNNIQIHRLTSQMSSYKSNDQTQLIQELRFLREKVQKQDEVINKLSNHLKFSQSEKTRSMNSLDHIASHSSLSKRNQDSVQDIYQIKNVQSNQKQEELNYQRKVIQKAKDIQLTFPQQQQKKQKENQYQNSLSESKLKNPKQNTNQENQSNKIKRVMEDSFDDFKRMVSDGNILDKDKDAINYKGKKLGFQQKLDLMEKYENNYVSEQSAKYYYFNPYTNLVQPFARKHEMLRPNLKIIKQYKQLLVESMVRRDFKSSQ